MGDSDLQSKFGKKYKGWIVVSKKVTGVKKNETESGNFFIFYKFRIKFKHLLEFSN